MDLFEQKKQKLYIWDKISNINFEEKKTVYNNIPTLKHDTGHF